MQAAASVVILTSTAPSSTVPAAARQRERGIADAGPAVAHRVEVLTCMGGGLSGLVASAPRRVGSDLPVARCSPSCEPATTCTAPGRCSHCGRGCSPRRAWLHPSTRIVHQQAPHADRSGAAPPGLDRSLRDGRGAGRRSRAQARPALLQRVLDTMGIGPDAACWWATHTTTPVQPLPWACCSLATRRGAGRLGAQAVLSDLPRCERGPEGLRSGGAGQPGSIAGDGFDAVPVTGGHSVFGRHEPPTQATLGRASQSVAVWARMPPVGRRPRPGGLEKALSTDGPPAATAGKNLAV